MSTNQFATNFPIPSPTNIFQCLWKLTRVMKAAGWTYKASGDGTNKDTSGTASSDLWGGSALPQQDSYTFGNILASTTMTVASSFPVTNATITVSNVKGTSINYTGFNSTGGVFYVNGQTTPVTYTAASGTTFTGCNGGPTLGSGTYSIKGVPALSDTVAGWIVLSGPQTLKLPLNANPTGTFIRGEIITQATTAAEGELLGYVWDSVGGSGWAAILPHTGTFNMTETNVIIGASSGATMNPLSGGTLVTFNREVMFYKDTTSVDATCYYICANASTESTQLFSSLATSAGCTASVGPGQGGTGNSFPAKGIVVRGTSGSTSATSIFQFTTNFQTNAQMACTNTTPSTGVSADGSFYCVVSNITTINTCSGIAFMRIDDGEPGDCDPYVFLTSGNSSTITSWTNTSTIGGGTITSYTFSSANLGGLVNEQPTPMFLGYQSRGGTADVVSAYMGAFSTNWQSSNNCSILSAGGLNNITRVVNTPVIGTARPAIIEPITIYTTGATGVSTSNTSQIKGRCRWLFWSGAGNTYNTLGSKTLLCLSSSQVTANAPNLCIAIGPYDGVTNPVL